MAADRHPIMVPWTAILEWICNYFYLFNKNLRWLWQRSNKNPNYQINRQLFSWLPMWKAPCHISKNSDSKSYPSRHGRILPGLMCKPKIWKVSWDMLFFLKRRGHKSYTRLQSKLLRRNTKYLEFYIKIWYKC